MSSSSPKAGKQASAPLVDGIVNHVLLQSGPDQLVHVFHFFLVEAILRHSPNPVIYWVEIWAIRRPQGEMNAGVSRCSSLIVSCALCTGALSCWNISQGSVTTHLRWGGIFINNIISQSQFRVCRWKNCENRSIFGKDMYKSIVSPFFTHGVYVQLL